MIEHKREMRELHEIVAKRSDEVTALLEAQHALRLRITEVGTALERARTEAHQGELALVTAEKDLRRAEDQIAHHDKRRDVVEHDLEELSEGIERARGEHEGARQKLDAGRDAREEGQAALDHVEMLAAEWRERVLGQQSVVTERKVRLARVRERATAMRGTVERLRRSVDELGARIAKLDEERTEAARGAGKAAAAMVVSREALVTAVAGAQAAHGELTLARQKLDEARQALGARENDLRSLRQALADATERLGKHEMALQKLAIEHTHLLEGVASASAGSQLARVVGDYHMRPLLDDDARARIAELVELSSAWARVNLDAVREHAEAEKRFAFYIEQKADLEKALDRPRAGDRRR